MSGEIRLGDAVALFRIGLAAGFLALFRSEYGVSFLLSLVCAALAQISDHLDGYLVRRYSTPTLVGWVLDSFADRAFYIAALMAFGREFGSHEVLVWMFTLREICLYAMRIVVGDFQAILPSFRMLALVHAGIIRIGIVVGCLAPFTFFSFSESALLASGAIGFFWIATVMGYLNLYLLFRAQR